jgi:hypothetical protein
MLRITFITACIFVCATTAQAKVLRFPDPISYEVSGQLFTLKQPTLYGNLIKRLGKPIQEDIGCVKSVDYANTSFVAYDEVVSNENERAFFIQSITLQKPQDKVVFESFSLNRDSSFSMVQKFHHRPVEVSDGMSMYFFDIPETKKYDAYGYILYFKNQRLVKFEQWENNC